MLKRKIRTLAVSGITIVAATVLTALFATGASATVTATANPGHANVASNTVVHAATAAANTSATPDSSTTPYYVCSLGDSSEGGLGCIFAPGHGNIVGTRYTRSTTLNLVLQPQETAGGFAWYELRYNGTNECLNWSPATGWVYEDSCIPNDPNEEWEHHGVNGDPNVLVNFASDFFLTTCQNRNSLLLASTYVNGSCTLSASPQIDWQFTVA